MVGSMSDDIQGVTECAQAYLDGLYKGDMDLLFNKAFHPDARMNAAEVAGERVHWNMEEFQKIVEDRPVPEAEGFPGRTASFPSISRGRTRPT